MTAAIASRQRQRATELLSAKSTAELRDYLFLAKSSWLNPIIREVLQDRGCVKISKARSSGTVVEVWEPSTVSGDPGWATVCEHGSICHHETRALAFAHSAAPEEWCETGCRHAVEGKHCPGCSSNRMDFHGDNWICMACGDEWPCNCSSVEEPPMASTG
jgi:hypothetical protein